MKKGFTLAEVLITLGIIGVVAALVMPSLIAKHKEKETVSRLKKNFSSLANAYTLILNEDGSPENWGFPDIPGGGYQDTGYAATSIIRNKFAPYFNISKNNGDVANTSMFLNDGTRIYFESRTSGTSCTQTRLIAGTNVSVCGVISVDTNGLGGPNKHGYDIFQFWLTPNSIIPTGLPGDTEFNLCKRSNADLFGCAAWVIYNENMDYLHCDDLNWNGKTKCD